MSSTKMMSLDFSIKFLNDLQKITHTHAHTKEKIKNLFTTHLLPPHCVLPPQPPQPPPPPYRHNKIQADVGPSVHIMSSTRKWEGIVGGGALKGKKWKGRVVDKVCWR